jgi:hypothetical protein
MWADHGLNGKFIPGLAALKPWDLFTHTEACLRQNEVLWIYLGNPYPSEYDPGYEIIFGAIESYFYFNRSNLNPIPLTFLNPGIEARAYRGPDDIASLFLTPYRRKEKGAQPVEVVKNFTLITEAELVYMGTNLTRKVIPPNTVLSVDDIPCVLYGLSPSGLLAMESLAMIEEIQSLLDYASMLGLGDLTSVEMEFISASELFRTGSYADARDILLNARQQTYSMLTDELRPMVEKGLKDPRNSEIPLNLLRGLSNADLAFRDGKMVHGETYLFSALRDWTATVHESILALFLSCLMAIVIGRWRSS